MAASSRIAISARKSIVLGAAISAKSFASGSTTAIFTTASSRIASRPPSAPTITPSSTNGQRMNQSVAPTSFITSTSRRRAYSDSRIVFAISRIDATPSRTANSAIVIFTTRVTERILFVSSSRLRTSSIAGSTTVRAPDGACGASASRSLAMSSGLVGVTRNVSGSGLEPSSW